MRRAMMTNRPTAGPPFTVGAAATSRASNSANDLQISLVNPAPRAGTITSASCYCAAGGTIRIFTGTWDGTTFTVAAASGDLTAAVGANTYPVSLAIPSGGYVGWYGVGPSLSMDTSGGSQVTAGSAAAPVAGGTYTGLSSTTRLISLEGTGS